MIRRNSFCSSELPSATRALDLFFDIVRPHPSLDTVKTFDSWTPLRPRAHSVGTIASEFALDLDPDIDDIVEELVLPQVDGPSAKRKAKKLERLKRRKKEFEAEAMAEVEPEPEYVKESEGRSEVGQQEEIGDVHVQSERDDEDDEKASSEHVEDVKHISGVVVVRGDRGVPAPQAEHEHEHEQQQQQQHIEEEANQDFSCHIHKRLACQFNSTCCVHKPTVSCGCSPPRSCCCMHHFGDCCYCESDPESPQSKTLSAGSRPAMPPNNTTSPAAPATVSTTASASSPPNPSGVTLMVTPASPSPSNHPETVVMGGAEDESTLTAQAALKLSNTLIGMMEASHMSDIRLTLHSATDQFWPITMTAHKCVLSRSPIITRLLKDPYYSLEIRALAGERFVMVKPWEQVVHFLYGRPILTPETLKPITLEGLGYQPFPDPECEPDYPFSLQAAMLDMALGYAVCGTFFYLRPVADAGFKLAIDMLSWETVEHILHFGLCTERFAVILPNPPWVEPMHSVLHPRDGNSHRQFAQEVAVDSASNDTPVNNNTNATQTTSEPIKKEASESKRDPVSASPEGPYPLYELKSDWSRRLVTAALNFIVDQIRFDFKLDCSAQTTFMPDRIPQFLKTPLYPPTPVTAIPVTARDKENVKPSTTVPTATATATAATPSAAVANNPRLADVKFGSFPEEEDKRQAASQIPPRTSYSYNAGTPAPTSRSTASFSGHGHEYNHANPSCSSTPCPEMFIASAILLSLPYDQLKLVFSMLSTRGVMTASLAQGIVLERESRRREALRAYARMVIDSVPKDQMVNAGAGTTTGTTAATATATGVSSGRKKGKARKAAKEKEKEREKEKEKEKGIENQNAGQNGSGKSETNASSGSGSSPATAPVIVPAVAPAAAAATASVVRLSVPIPPAVEELRYREFFSSKVVSRGHGTEEKVQVEILLERELVGFEF